MSSRWMHVAAAGVTANVFLRLAELGLVLLLFTDASQTDLTVLRSIGTLPCRLLSTGMFLTILLAGLLPDLCFPACRFGKQAFCPPFLPRPTLGSARLS